MPIWLVKLFHSLGRKSAAKRTGIAKIPTTISAEGHGAGLYTQLREAGFTDEALTKLIKSEKDIIRLVNKVESMQKQQTSKVISQGDPEFQAITDKLLGKKAKVHPFQGMTPRIQQDVDGIIKNLKTMEPVDAMKEANSIIGRKGKYKNLSGDEAQRILKETDDHIFQRDIKYDEFGDPIKPDPEDMAEGGIMRAGFPFGGPASGKLALKAIRDAWRANKTWGVGGPPYKPEKTSFNIKELTKQNFGEELSLTDLRRLSESPLAGPQKGRFKEFNKEFKNIKASILKEKMMEKKLEAKAMIHSADMVPANTEIEKRVQAQFTREGKKQLAEAKEGLKEIDIYMGMLQKKGRSVHQSGGLAYMLGEPNTRIEALQHAGVIADPRGLYTDPSIYSKGESEIPQNYYAGGGVGHGPWTTGRKAPEAEQGQDEMPIPRVASKPDPLKAPRGLPSVAPKNMDPAYMQQQMMQQAMMGRGPGNTGQGPRPMAAEGGLMRMGFKKGGDWTRRKFLQFLGGAAALPIFGKYFKAAKLAKPAAKVTETIIKSNAPGMPAWFPHLVKRVIKEGKDETEKLATIERQTVHTAKTPEGTPIQVTRDLVTDDIVVDIGEQTKHGWSAGRHGQPVRLELKKGEWIEPSTTEGGYVTKGGENVYPGMSKGFRESEEVITKPGKSSPSIKSKDEFTVDEAEFTGGHPENVKFEETVQFKYGDHGSDFSEIEQYAMKKHSSSVESVGEVSRAQRREGMWGKKEQARQLAMDKKHGGLKSTYKKDPHVRGKQADKDAWAEGRAESQAEEFDEFASGGLARLLGE